jgi:hypothetical protein
LLHAGKKRSTLVSLLLSVSEQVEAAARALDGGAEVGLSDSDSDISIGEIPIISKVTPIKGNKESGKGTAGRGGGKEESEFDRLVREAAAYV